jgi:Ca2+-binding EF-hand superfamily protein
MKKYVILAVATMVASSCSMMDHHGKKHHGKFADKMFENQDRNQDGVITKDEVTSNHKEMFKAIDTNKDGKMSRLEAQNARREKTFEQSGNKTKKGYVTSKESLVAEKDRFEEQDTDKNGKVTKEEYKQYFKKTWEERKNKEENND